LKEHAKIWYPGKMPTLEKIGSSSYGNFEISKAVGDPEDPGGPARAGSNPGIGISAPTVVSEARFR